LTKCKYPHLNYSTKAKLSKSEKSILAKNMYAMAIGRFSFTAANGLQNVIISVMIGLIQSGIYSNYQMIVSSINVMMTKLFGSFTPSVGSLNVESKIEDTKKVFERLEFASFWLHGTCAACLLTTLNPFINAWIGEEYLLTYDCVIGLVVNILVIGLWRTTGTFKNGCGIFYQGRHGLLICSILTVLFSITLAGAFGIAGVIWAPIISRILTLSWHDPWLLYKYVFKEKPFAYYRQTVLYFFIGVLTLIICSCICQFSIGTSWLLFFENGIISFVASQLVFYVIFRKTRSFLYFFDLIKGKVLKGR